MNIERLYVQDVYDKIAKEFSDTRYRPWTNVELFLNNIPKYSLIGDIGCGNGKNMLYKPDTYSIGSDFSMGLLQICAKRNLSVFGSDILNIASRDNIFDYTICIAVIHHLSTELKRRKAINELIRITKKGGQILILVWALEQETTSRRKFIQQENFVDFKDNKQNLLGKRYYYVFKKNELESIIPEGVEIIHSFYEKGNWGVIIQK